MSIIIFQILCYPTQKNVTQWKVHNLFTVLITYIGVIAKHLRRKKKKYEEIIIRRNRLHAGHLC